MSSPMCRGRAGHASDRGGTRQCWMDTPQSIAVIDVGATNTKLFHFSPELRAIEHRSRPVELLRRPPYTQIDSDAVLSFAAEVIRQFDAAVPVDAIITTCHGSALALLDADGELAFPIMSYLADIPDDIAAAYSAIEPPFDEVLAPTNPLGLTPGRQLLWQETRWPDAFANVSSVLPYAQYIGYRLCGVAASEVTSLGAQTHLWAPIEKGFSSLARARGWDRLIAPLRNAHDVLGPAKALRLNGLGRVHCGLHDSNANFLRYAPLAPLCLLSTGTWIIAFDSAASIHSLDEEKDQVSNSMASGEPIACARFMGGEEYARIADPSGRGVPSIEMTGKLVDRNVAVWPSFTHSGGPLPWTGGKGRILSSVALDEDAAASLASLYVAQMTALMLEGMAGAKRVVVDGVFAQNEVFLSVLAELLPDRRLHRSLEKHGTAAGAATLALPEPKLAPLPTYAPVSHKRMPGLREYHARWKRMLEVDYGRSAT